RLDVVQRKALVGSPARGSGAWDSDYAGRVGRLDGALPAASLHFNGACVPGSNIFLSRHVYCAVHIARLETRAPARRGTGRGGRDTDVRTRGNGSAYSGPLFAADSARLRNGD